MPNVAHLLTAATMIAAACSAQAGTPLAWIGELAQGYVGQTADFLEGQRQRRDSKRRAERADADGRRNKYSRISLDGPGDCEEGAEMSDAETDDGHGPTELEVTPDNLALISNKVLKRMGLSAESPDKLQQLHTAAVTLHDQAEAEHATLKQKEDNIKEQIQAAAAETIEAKIKTEADHLKRHQSALDEYPELWSLVEIVNTNTQCVVTEVSAWKHRQLNSRERKIANRRLAQLEMDRLTAKKRLVIIDNALELARKRLPIEATQPRRRWRRLPSFGFGS